MLYIISAARNMFPLLLRLLKSLPVVGDILSAFEGNKPGTGDDDDASSSRRNRKSKYYENNFYA
jgi:hypothetical protein